jgi:hypothetical protein
MRSGLIFRVSDHISNRFLLCRMLSASARKMHRDGVSMSQSINRSLVVLDGAQDHPSPQKSSVNAESPSNVDAVNPEGNLSDAARREASTEKEQGARTERLEAFVESADD